jgi:cytochrome oxidase assembly protein ShyY1
MLDCLVMLHFHIGSQITDIRKIKEAIREAGRVYAKLRALGVPIQYLNLGGGLGVDYDGSKTAFDSSMNYSVQEYANDVVYTVQQICEEEKVPAPILVTESGRAVTAVGTYAGAEQLLVGPRRLAGRTGYWVVTPLDVTESHARLAVVRGFVTDLGSVRPPPAGQVEVDGSLAPGESPADPPAGLPAGAPTALGSIDLSVLVNRWPGELFNAFVFAQGEKTAAGAEIRATAGLERVPPPEVTGGLKWRNAAYALQWWMFAGFAAFMWFRMVRDDAARD